jgi:hypothetical protein
MERFLIVYRGAPGGSPDAAHQPRRWDDWFVALGARVIDRGSLTHSSVEIKTRLAGPKTSASSLSGYAIVAAADFNEAVKLAERCPIFDEQGSVEIARLTGTPG